jgi:DNA (cytosine-5)-methyltransferase 1
MTSLSPTAKTIDSAAPKEVRGDDWSYLRSRQPALVSASRGRLGFVDLFSGCGGMSLGIAEAARDAGLVPVVGGAVDFVAPAAAVYADNFGADRVLTDDVSHLLPLSQSEGITSFETNTLDALGGRVNVVVGGPPCQGHSDLNNYTRRDDPKNELYLVMARAATHMRPDAILIENVQGSRHDKGGAVWKTAALLEAAGYVVDSHLVELGSIGVAQQRRRFVMLATLLPRPPIAELLAPFETTPRPLSWAIDDVSVPEAGLMGAISSLSKDNRERLQYLFDNDLHDLPNSERPPCHRDKVHSYNSVYGRLHADKLAPTLTGGFYSMCMGRYVHPTERRTLTAREAARIQFFPDSFRFDAARSRTAVAKMIGNAVPMKMTYALVSELIRLGVVGGDRPGA